MNHRSFQTHAFKLLLRSLLFLSILNVAAVNADANDRYPGITARQDSLASRYVHLVHAFQWDSSRVVSHNLSELERQEGLLPIGDLLMLSSGVFRLQNGEYENKQEYAYLVARVDSIYDVGLSRCERFRSADTAWSITLDFIRGGLRGYYATLKILDNPLEALYAGRQALGLLESVLQRDSSFADAYLGLGIFHCTLAKAPDIIRKGLEFLGTESQMEEGIEYLRRCASDGRYSATAANLYLIRFLSPYYGHLAQEKFARLDTLQKRHPGNAYYAFLASDEALCFHPGLFFSRQWREQLATALPLFSNASYSLRRYNQLVRYQYRLLEPLQDSLNDADSSIVLNDFSYYPLFLWSIQQSRVAAELPEELNLGALCGRLVRKSLDKTQDHFDEVDMPPLLRGHYQWHLNAAFARE